VVEYLLDQFYLRVLTPLSARDDVGVIDLRDKLRGYPANKVWYDEIHPNDNGYQLLAEHYVPVLQKWYPGWF
jgi:lysophospholipase L1-like esterase